MQRLNVNLPDNEMKILENYCNSQNRTKTDVVREWVRSLKEKIPTQKE
ncbi:MAG TPA: CopG family transcriptional regulator [Cyanobacteria bacterium UBA11369]|nr:CopG family transcriptional regulator [Cyanobacteria bacterium UBA11371]HBE54391.1 CopG family transcriptional regulator [Cyanobacteria bacterium UBA11369]